MREYKEETIMIDTIEALGKGSVIQHGKHNDRVYVMKLKKDDIELILDKISTLAYTYNYSKIFCKVPKNLAPIFFAEGYFLEAYIPKFYNNEDDVLFVSKFLNSDRLLNIEKDQLSGLSQLLQNKQQKKIDVKKITSEYIVRKLDKSDIDQIAGLYSAVFDSYPFPIDNPDYILKTMKDNVQYFGAEKNGTLAALASSEMDVEGKNAEMTDFATHVDHHGNNLSFILLMAMEHEMKVQGIHTVFTIARLNSIPMNKTFLRSGYQYSGTLIKNTNIAGKIESMNTYYKQL